MGVYALFEASDKVVKKAFTEDELCEQPAIELFQSLGWHAVCAENEALRADGNPGRDTTSEVVLTVRLGQALQDLNPDLPIEAIGLAVDEIIRDRTAMSLAAANREVSTLLKDGVKVAIQDRENGGQKTVQVRVIDWQVPQNNEFLLVSQMSITGDLYTCRPDLIAFVNGLPLVVIELKKPGVSARVAFDDNLTHYKAQIPQLFWFNAFMIASNGTESTVGSLTANWERFFEWKRIEREDEPRRVSLEVMIRGTCEPSRLLDLVENFILFSEEKSGLSKIVGQNHQFLGVNNALAAMLKAREEGHGRAGVFWQTQGSGKSYSMVFYAQKVLRKLEGNWTFVVVTDRTELDDQIARTFKACGAVTATDADQCHASTCAHLRELLRGNHRYVFTLIHKFRPEDSPSTTGRGKKGEGAAQSMPVLSDRRDIIVLVDEAHRSQYDTLALNMRAALPNALFVAFTGTPLMAGEERTREVFGDYVSVYDFQQSVEDGATVPLYYENRTPELQLENPNLNDEIYDAIEAAELDEDQEKKLERELGRQYHIITRNDRLETVAKDIVRHFLGRGFQGKAMVISIDKATALKMHKKVRKHWDRERARVESELAELQKYQVGPAVPAGRPESEATKIQELNDRLTILNETDMAVIVSPGQNEIEQMKKLDLDIVPHRKRMIEEDLDEQFKDPDNKLRIAFVCAMWLTGFDAPSCSTVYLDKPMRNHTLMQTIARANRVFPGKHSGMIVDYCNVFASLERALAIYGQGRGGATPVRDKQELIKELRTALKAAVAFCSSHGANIGTIENAPGLERVQRMEEARDRLITPDQIRKDFYAHVRLVRALFDAIKPDPAVLEFASVVSCLARIEEMIRLELGGGEPPDISNVLAEINGVLDRSITSDGFVIHETKGGKPLPLLDLSKIDFAALAKKFEKSKHKNTELERLKAAIQAQLERVIRLNPTRADYAQKFEELIDSYNNGSRNVEELFKELLKLTRDLSDEDHRHLRENLSQEELVIFDLLTRPGPDLSPAERDEVKKVSKDLLNRIKTLLVLNWRGRTQSRAQVRLTIEDTLDTGLPRAYTPDIYNRKVSALFEHLYERYPGEGVTIYATLESFHRESQKGREL